MHAACWLVIQVYLTAFQNQFCQALMPSTAHLYKNNEQLLKNMKIKTYLLFFLLLAVFTPVSLGSVVEISARGRLVGMSSSSLPLKSNLDGYGPRLRRFLEEFLFCLPFDPHLGPAHYLYIFGIICERFAGILLNDFPDQFWRVSSFDTLLSTFE